MRSESLIRLDGGQAPSLDSHSAAARQAELDRQKAEFFANGGEVKVLPGVAAQNPEYQFGRGPTIDPVTGKVMIHAQREQFKGRWVLRLDLIGGMSGRSPSGIRNLVVRGKFPKPVPGTRPQAWDEDEVRAWIERNPIDPKSQRHAI